MTTTLMTMANPFILVNLTVNFGCNRSKKSSIKTLPQRIFTLLYIFSDSLVSDINLPPKYTFRPHQTVPGHYHTFRLHRNLHLRPHFPFSFPFPPRTTGQWELESGNSILLGFIMINFMSLRQSSLNSILIG